MKKVLTLALLFITTSVFAQTSPNLVGNWKGVGNSAVPGSGAFYPSEAGKEKPVRYKHVEYVLIINSEE